MTLRTRGELSTLANPCRAKPDLLVSLAEFCEPKRNPSTPCHPSGAVEISLARERSSTPATMKLMARNIAAGSSKLYANLRP